MIDYTLRSSCQGNEAGCCGELHVGFYLGRTKLGVTTWSPGEISGASIDARHQISLRQNAWVVRTEVENRQDNEALEHVESHREADAFAAQDVAKLMQRLAEYTLGLVIQWGKTKGLGRTKKQTPLPLPSDRTLRTAFVYEVRDCGVGLLPEWNNQCQSIQCWIARAER